VNTVNSQEIFHVRNDSVPACVSMVEKAHGEGLGFSHPEVDPSGRQDREKSLFKRRLTCIVEIQPATDVCYFSLSFSSTVCRARSRAVSSASSVPIMNSPAPRVSCTVTSPGTLAERVSLISSIDGFGSNLT